MGRAARAVLSGAASRYMPSNSMAAAVKRGAMEAGGVALAARLGESLKRSGTTKANRSTKGDSVSSVLKGRSSAAPVSFGTRYVSKAPRILKTSRGSQRIIQRELIATPIVGTTSYNISTSISQFDIQPGLAKLLPWGNSVAAQYEQYHINSMTFHYVPFISTATPGSVMMMVDYNAVDIPPATESQFMDHAGAVSGAAWEPLSFRCDVSQMHGLGPRKFIRTCAVAGDQKTYDSGVFYLATDNGTAVNWGKLYVEYDIELFTPQLNPPTYGAPQQTSAWVSSAAITMATATPSALTTDPLTFDGLGWNPFVSGHIFTPPAGFYRIEAVASCKDTVGELFTAQIYMTKDAVQYPNPLINEQQATVAAGGYLTVTAQWFVACSGTSAIRFGAVLTGAAGVLTIESLTIAISLA